MFKPENNGLKVRRHPLTDLDFDTNPDRVSADIWDWKQNMSIGNPKSAEIPQPFFTPNREEPPMEQVAQLASPIAQAIFAGDYDNDLEEIVNAVQNRRAVVRGIQNAAKRAELQVGDRVRFVDLSPRYMEGLEATIVEFNRSRIAVKVVEEHKVAARRFGHGMVTVKPHMIDKV